jgi:S1-C subfamily serine protease
MLQPGPAAIWRALRPGLAWWLPFGLPFWLAAVSLAHAAAPTAALHNTSPASAASLALAGVVSARANALAVPALPAPPAASAASAAAEQVLTGTGQRIYERTRPLLLQVRTLLKTQDSQASVGSGFLVDDGVHLVTNFHVVSQFALQPARYRLTYSTVDGHQGALRLLAIDVVHDLALLGFVDPAPLAGRGAVAFRPASEPLGRGARIFSLGNPLDVGFAVAEGSYNGPVERSFLETLFFGGSLSPGMSGGPALDDQGRLIGVNVAARRDGEQVSFLVPAAPVRDLIARGRNAPPITSPAWAEVTRQLMGYQAALTDRFVALPWRSAGHPRYRVPVPQEAFMRCWGRSSNQALRGLQFEHSECQMDSRIFINESLLTGFLIVRHESYDGSKIGALRFNERYSDSFRNEFMGHDDRNRTAPQCSERQVEVRADPGDKSIKPGLPLKAVVCLRAYKKLPGLFDVSVLVATLDGSITGVQGRLDAFGVSAPNAQRLARKYLDGFAWNAPSPASH